MHPNTTPPTPARLPNMLELAQLTSPEGLLPSTLVPLLPLQELERRAHEINVTHPQYREETPLVLAWEQQRRQRLSGQLHVVGRPAVAQVSTTFSVA
jgi:hypothetical protein